MSKYCYNRQRQILTQYPLNFLGVSRRKNANYRIRFRIWPLRSSQWDEGLIINLGAGRLKPLIGLDSGPRLGEEAASFFTATSTKSIGAHDHFHMFRCNHLKIPFRNEKKPVCLTLILISLESWGIFQHKNLAKRSSLTIRLTSFEQDYDLLCAQMTLHESDYNQRHARFKIITRLVLDIMEPERAYACL